MSEWLETLPEALRDAPFIGKAESLEDAVGKLAHAATLVGTSVRIPGEDASDDDRAAFYTKLQEIPGVAQLPDPDDMEGMAALLGKLGAPADHTEYKLPEVENFTWDEGIGEDLRKFAQQSGLTKAQFKQFATNIAGQEQEAGMTSSVQLEEARKALRLDWGETMEEREGLIRGYLEHSEAPESMKKLFEDKNLPLDSMNWLHSIAKQFKGEVTPIKDQESIGTPTMSPSEARERIPKIIDQMLELGPTHPRYRDLQAEMNLAQVAVNAA